MQAKLQRAYQGSILMNFLVFETMRVNFTQGT